MGNQNFIKVLMDHIIQTAKAEGLHYVLTSSYENHISNRGYIHRTVQKVFSSLGTVQGFGLTTGPTAAFQSLVANLSVAWADEPAGS